jgi:hypothetical protein
MGQSNSGTLGAEQPYGFRAARQLAAPATQPITASEPGAATTKIQGNVEEEFARCGVKLNAASISGQWQRARQTAMKPCPAA